MFFFSSRNLNSHNVCPTFHYLSRKGEFIHVLNYVGVGIAQVSITMGYGLDGPGSIPGSVRFLSSPQRPDRLWGPPSLLSNGYRQLLPRGKAGGARS
jgi:hypothetical protein